MTDEQQADWPDAARLATIITEGMGNWHQAGINPELIARSHIMAWMHLVQSGWGEETLIDWLRTNADLVERGVLAVGRERAN
jgi:hypothetical protein